MRALIFSCLFLLIQISAVASPPEYCPFFNESVHKEFNFLSNFYEYPIDHPLGTFKCSEALYQYQKFTHLDDAKFKQDFLSADGQKAYDLSRKHATLVRSNWDKEKAMRHTLEHKFSYPELKDKLLKTGSAYLVENSPKGHDSYWADNGDGTGKNRLGIMLMELRAALGGHGVVEVPISLKKIYEKAVREEKLVLGHFSTYIQSSPLPDGSGRFLYFELNNMPGLVEEGAKLIAERISSLKLANPYFVAPEASTIALAHVLRTKYGIAGTILPKQKKLNAIDPYKEEYSAVTALEKKTLYLDSALDLKGKDIVIIDNVCTSGETLRATYRLLKQAGVESSAIREAIVLFTEGDDISQLRIDDNNVLPLHRFGHLPILPNEVNDDGVLFKPFSSTDLPTEFGVMKFYVFKHRYSKVEAIACVSPATSSKTLIPVRIHDACITSETFHSVKCDCKKQLNKALEYISQNGGVVIYLNQEGRGIGLGNKIAAYNLQETYKLDTVDANRALNLPDDMREYTAVVDILKYLGIESIQLITNNPRKVDCLTHLGIDVQGIIPCIVTPDSPQMEKYIQDKAKRMGHMISR